MQSTKLSGLLASFEKKDWKDFVRFLKSPWFNSNEILVEMTIFLQDYFRKKEKWPDRKEVWKVIFPKKKLNDAYMRNLISDLYKLGQRFLVQKAYEEDPFVGGMLSLRTFNDKELSYEWEKTAGKSPPSPSDGLGWWEENLYFLYRREKERYYYEGKKNVRTFHSGLSDLLRNLDRFYLLEKFRNYAEVLNQTRVVVGGAGPSLVEPDPLLGAVDLGDLEEDPLILAFVLACKMLKNPESEGNYNGFIKHINLRALDLPKLEAKELYNLALNYCIQKINKGNRGYLEKLFNLYNDIITADLLLSDGELEPWNYKNICTLALRLERFDWAIAFIEDYKEKIGGSFKEEAYTYNLAQWHFWKKEYSQTLSLLMSSNLNSDLYFGTDSRIIIMRIYLEEKNFVMLQKFLPLFEQYLKRNKKLAPNRKSSQLKRVRYMKRIVNLDKFTAANGEKIRAEITEEGPGVDKKFLLDALESRLASIK